MKLNFSESRLKSVVALVLAIVLIIQILPRFSTAISGTEGDYKGEVETVEFVPEHSVYDSGVILLYSEKQLKLIGTDQVLTDRDYESSTIGQGNTVSENGNDVCYSSGATYRIAEDFEITDFYWPDGFTGSFLPAGSAEEKPLYDVESDTIYLYNAMQLAVMQMSNREDQVMLSGDNDESTFGVGTPIADEKGNPVTYGAGHHYVMTSSFTYHYVMPTATLKAAAKAPAKAPGAKAAAQYEGRDFAGQVIKKIGDKTYILIGNEAQLRAIGSDKEVMGPVYETQYHINVTWTADTGPKGTAVLLYGGDADLEKDQNDYADFNFQSVNDKNGGGTVYYGVPDYETGALDFTSSNTTLTKSNVKKSGEKYSIGSDYIIFRDIDLGGQGDAWTPLMFNGEMYGIKASADDSGRTIGDLFDAYDSLSLSEKDTIRPVISNVYVNQSEAIDVAEYEGIGFFATVTNKTNTANIGLAGEQAVVKNVELQNVEVRNTTTEVEVDQTVVNALTSGLGTVTGWLLDKLLVVLSIGSVKTDLQHTLSNLLNAKAEDPSCRATGAFAGRLVGDVLIEDCVVSGGATGSVKVENVNDRTGGFVGYSIGLTEYSGLSQTLGAVVDGLAMILNLVPALGLGDLVTILLGNNTLPVGQLIPTGYKAPTINRCEVSELTGYVGKDNTQFIGGFIGHQIGTKINDSFVKHSNYTINAANYGGGFCGNMRDAEIKGTLDGVGVDLSEAILNAIKDEVDNIHPQSVTQRCKVEDCIYTVVGGNMLGGFCGVQNSGVIVDDSINCPDNDLVVHSTGNMAGGFSGYATVGWLSSLGEDENNENSLLGTVRQLATSLLSTDQSTGQRLLSLMGLAPSTILGSYGTEAGGDYSPTINCKTINVTAEAYVPEGKSEKENGNFAGGLLGKGDGVYVGSSDQAAFESINNWDGENLGINATGNPIVIQYLESVTAENYAGGVVGYDGSAAFQGLLNGVAGLGDFIGFDAHHITVNGVDEGYTVKAQNYNAGGAFGLAVGGTAEDVTLNKVKRVEAVNRAAGFVGVAGPGELIGTGALTVNLLGLDRLLSVQNLLSAGQGLEVHITDCTVNGIDEGFTVEAFGGESEVYEYTASGFIADSNSTKIVNSHTFNLMSVTSPDEYGYSGGFVGTSETGGLAEVANEDDTSVKRLIEADGLVKAIGYLIPSYTNCSVHFIPEQGFVQGDLAGGFAADFESGTVNNGGVIDEEYPELSIAPYSEGPFCVFEIDEVRGQTFGGGFGARVVSGALASAGGGVSILGRTDASLNVADLLNVVEAYVPYVKYAGVSSQAGFTVEAKRVLTTAGKLDTGAAGGFIGYASGAQVSYSDVMYLKHTNVTPPDYLESVLAPTYFDIGTGEKQSRYAVTGGRHAGGYIGNMDIGSAASLGGGLGILKDLLNITSVTQALSVVVSTVEHSKVEGKPGGFAVLATGDDQYGKVGKSGGFAGEISGGHVQDSHAVLFSYIIGEEMAGGYVGNYKPGDVAKLLDNLSAEDDGSVLKKLLSNLVDVNSGLLTLIQSFIPTIRNSTTSCIPCGGAVRAQAASDNQFQRGCAGGYCGHNEGGSIWGMDSHTWQTENDGVGRVFGRKTDNTSIGSYTGVKSECVANRIHSVYGFEYAGGFTGYMEPASTANTGNLKLLGGLVTASNLLSALDVTYPTEENTVVWGPLRNLDVKTWNAWLRFVGKYGAYAYEFAKTDPIDITLPEEEQQEQLDTYLAKYIYGTNVVAGREYDAKANNELLITEGGNAGGYVGFMVSGTVTNGQAHDTKFVRGMRNAGGFAGKLKAGGAAEFGNVNLLGLDLEVGSLIKAGQVFVPCIKNSSVEGFRNGLRVYAPSDDFVHNCGNAGGYVGSSYGGQIWGDADLPDGLPEGYTYEKGCNVTNLRYVQGRNHVGGYAGLVTAASVADVNTNAGTGFLQGILDTVVSKSNGDLANVLEATVSTIRGAEVSASEDEWGFVVEGINKNYPRYAGGFVGTSEAAVIGDKDGNTESKLTVNDLRSVDGLYYAGGFVGLADVGSVADVSATDNNNEKTSVLDLINLGNTTVLDVFRTYIYYADVNGVQEGLWVCAHSADSAGILSEERFSGCAGGFGGGIMNGTVTYSNVRNLSTVLGINYSGGFVGHLGKSGVADVDSAEISKLLGLTAGVLDVFGSHVENSTVSGIGKGFIVSSRAGENETYECITGGFAGYADISRIKKSSTFSEKQVLSDEIAGGFVGKTDMHYLVNAQIDSKLVDLVLLIVDTLVKALYLDKAEQLNLINTGTIPGLESIQNVLGLRLLADGDLLYVNLLGLRIGVSLHKGEGENGTDVARITIGDSEIVLPCNDSGLVDSQGNKESVRVNLIKGNRTKVENCDTHGIDIGYDVYGGGADYENEGTGTRGIAGGFAGYNHEGELANNNMYYCDEVKGTPGLVGHFTGKSELDSVYSFNTMESIEGPNDDSTNVYRVYRVTSQTTAESADSTPIATAQVDDGTPVTYQRFDVTHRQSPIVEFADWKDATMGGGAEKIDVYISAGEADLMLRTKTKDNGQTEVPEPPQDNDPCEAKIDFTVQKIWDDTFNLDGIRPDSIKIKLYRTEVDKDGNIVSGPSLYDPDGVGYILIMTEDDGRWYQSTWTHVIKGLPNAYKPDPDGETIIYYLYSADEVIEEIPGYTRTFDDPPDDRGMITVIRNKHQPLLPFTGGLGDRIIFIGMLVILASYITLRVVLRAEERKKRKIRQDSG